MDTSLISPEVRELMTRLYKECADTHENSHVNDKGD